MISFKEFYEKGVAAATQAEQNHAEVDEVFKQLNQEIGEITSNAIEFDVLEFREQSHPLKVNIFEEANKYMAVAARNPKAQTPWVELARWEQDHSGYPCRIKFPTGTKYCEDKEAVTGGLAQLISEAVIAKKIRNLVARSDDN